MAWQGVFGIEEIALQFARANARGRLGGSFLFVGPQGIGKRVFAFQLAKTLLCRRQFAEAGSPILRDGESVESASNEELLARFQPCGECDSCKQFDFDVVATEVVMPTHPDFIYVRKPAERSFIPIELLIGEREARMQSGFCAELRRTTFLGGRRVAILDDADYLNEEGANALLKTLEEPPKNTIVILVGTSATKQLPTIRSRCQIFRFAPLTSANVADVLLTQEAVGSPEEAEAIARNSGGSMTEAYRALNPDFSQFLHTLLTELSRTPFNAVQLAAKVCEYVDAGGKEGSVRRPRLQHILLSALVYFRTMYRELVADGARFDSEPGFATARPFARRALNAREHSPEYVLACEERTLEALEQIDRNANLPFVVEAWLYDLGEYRRRDRRPLF